MSSNNQLSAANTNLAALLNACEQELVAEREKATYWELRCRESRKQLDAEQEITYDLREQLTNVVNEHHKDCIQSLTEAIVAIKRMQGATIDELPAEVQRIGDEILAKAKDVNIVEQ